MPSRLCIFLPKTPGCCHCPSILALFLACIVFILFLERHPAAHGHCSCTPAPPREQYSHTSPFPLSYRASPQTAPQHGKKQDALTGLRVLSWRLWKWEGETEHQARSRVNSTKLPPQSENQEPREDWELPFSLRIILQTLPGLCVLTVGGCPQCSGEFYLEQKVLKLVEASFTHLSSNLC